MPVTSTGLILLCTPESVCLSNVLKYVICDICDPCHTMCCSLFTLKRIQKHSQHPKKNKKHKRANKIESGIEDPKLCKTQTDRKSEKLS